MTTQNESTDTYVKILKFEEGILHVKLKGFLKPVLMADFHLQMDDFMSKHKVDFFLIDQSELKVLTKEIREGIMDAINRMSKQGKGIKKVAAIMPADIFAQAGLDTIQRSTHNMSETPHKTFQTEKECLDWLKQ